VEALILKAKTIHNQNCSYKNLWLAVIDNAIADWSQGSAQHKQKAEYFLFQDEDDFPFVCRSAGLNPESVRETLWAMRASTIHDARVA